MRKFFLGMAVFLMVISPLFAGEGVSQKELGELLGDSYMIEQNYDRSVKQYREALAKDPQNAKVRTSLADVLSWQKKYDEAISEYHRTLKFLKTPMEILEVEKKLASVYVWKRDYLEAEALYQELMAQDPGDAKNTIALAEVCLRLGKTEESKRLLRGVLEKDPQNTDAKVLLGDVDAGNGNFPEALKLYREALDVKYDRKVKAKIGNVQSWTRNYGDALKIYDELLAEKEEKPLRIQKARILGWERKFRQSRKEYQRILDQGPDELVKEEMDAKEFYWRNRVKRAIAAYKKLISNAPENAEAMFDLSQVYSYQSMWREAIKQYKDLLELFPDHARAKEGLKKAELLASHPLLTSGYEFFKAHSGARGVDIHKNAFNNLLAIPLSMQATMELGYSFVRRSFLDYRDLSENQARIGFGYQKNPNWSAGAFFNLITYYKGIAPVYEFGGQFAFRTFDIGQMTLSQEQRRLENNSAVILRRLFQNNFKVRQDVDITKRLKAGADYTFSYFSDHNRCNDVAGDTLFYLSLEPRALYVKYRYEFRNFLKEEADYFSPQEYSLHTISVRWKHFLNKEEIFFGANDLYYEAGYDLSFDSQGITSHQVMGGLTWDISKRLQIKGEGQYTIASTKIYEDAGGKGTVRYFF
jgi:tetratricopeptide (TPR) repeat protein